VGAGVAAGKDQVKELRVDSKTERQRMKVLEAEVARIHQRALKEKRGNRSRRGRQKDAVEKRRTETARVETLHGGNNVLDDDDCCELVIFLTSKGAGDSASRFSETMVVKLEDDCMSLHTADFEDTGLCWLTPWAKQ